MANINDLSTQYSSEADLLKKQIERLESGAPIGGVSAKFDTSALKQRLAAIEPSVKEEQRAIKLSKEAKGRLLEYGKQGDVLQAELPGRTEAINQAVDSRLQSLIGDVGYQLGESKQQLGSAMASRGLLRSSGTEQGIGQLDLAAQQDALNLKNEAIATKQQARTLEEKTISGIKEAKKQATEARKRGELSTINQVLNENKMNELRSNFDQQLETMQLSMSARQATASAYGALAGEIGRLLGGLGSASNTQKQTDLNSETTPGMLGR